MKRPLSASLICVLALLTLGACAPDLPRADEMLGESSQGQAFPVLLPLDPILARGTGAPRAQAAQVTLTARGAALTGTRIAAPRTDDIAARGRALRERAARLRDAPV